MDDEVGANSEHGRLQHQPQDLGGCAKASGGVARAPVVRKIIRIDLAPAPDEMRDHAHGDQSFGIAPAQGVWYCAIAPAWPPFLSA